MLIASNPQEAIKLVNGKSLYLEQDDFYWVETEKGIAKVLKPLSKERVKQILLDGEFPESYLLEIFNAKKTKALEQVLKAEDTQGLIVSGQAGIGKTFAVIFKIAKLVKNHKIKSPLYLTLQDFNVKRELFEEKRLSNYDAILLDDVNPNLNQLEKKFVLSVIFHLYNNRHKKRLYITTNASIKDLFLFIAEEPVVSRLKEICTILQINESKDLRLLKSKRG